MSILSAIIVPHPPVIVPEIGMGQEAAIQATIDSYYEVAKMAGDQEPETIIVISPHAVAYADYIHIASGDRIKGSLKQFGGKEEIEVNLDEALTAEVCRLCDKRSFPAGTSGGSVTMDHGTFVPLHFINQFYTDYRLLVCSLSGLPGEDHYAFGKIVKEAVTNLGRRAVIIASGDLSHKLMASGPYQYAKEGPELDLALTSVMKKGVLTDFLKVDDRLCRMGAECGLGSFVMMAGILDQIKVIPRFLSYEGPFGVGYAVSAFLPDDEKGEMESVREQEDAYVRLARETLSQYICTGKMFSVPELPERMMKERAGAFVSIKKDGQLRGCIGTISAAQDNIALEIMHNAISSGTRDPRFPAVQEEELSKLVYNVDVLATAEPVTDMAMLDPKRFGVIVSKGIKRGLLLPNLDGVDTVEQQISIACQKAGIAPGEDYDLECFEVVRHT